MGFFKKIKGIFTEDNKKISLEEAASIISERIVKISSSCSLEIKKECKNEPKRPELNNDRLLTIMIDFENFFLHTSYRISWKYLDKNNSQTFMDKLFDKNINSRMKLLEKFNSKCSENFYEYKNKMIKNCNDFQDEYCQYNKDLFEKFGRKVSKDIGRPNDIPLIMFSSELSVSSLDYLDVKNVLLLCK
ncbi:MAG: hypothetical protein K9M80_02130 [Candidatus Marinimicrobia bacterium]|nr:hypothetical protein [Candidatus Neomarinimicrobiota bacterium]